MSYTRGIRIAGVDFSNQICQDSMVIGYEKITGLSEVRTEDLVLHDDMLGWVRTIKFKVNVLEESDALTLINLLRQSQVTIRITDPATGVAESILCQPSTPNIEQLLTSWNGKTYWKLGEISFRERSGHSV